jgi:hypothetical protein
MAQEKTIEEKLRLLERELSTVAEALDKTNMSLREIEDLKTELKAFKIFLGRHFPEFKKEFPEILKKV